MNPDHLNPDHANPDHANPQVYRELAEAGWRWVLDQVGWGEDGPSIPETVADDGTPGEPEGLPTGMYSGVGGLAHVLAEVRLSRAWTEEEQELAAGIVGRVRRGLSVRPRRGQDQREPQYRQSHRSALHASLLFRSISPGLGSRRRVRARRPLPPRRP